MSYELYCYEPTVPKPDLDDARRRIEIDQDLEFEPISDAEWQKMRRVADALVEFDPRLEIFEPDFDEISKAHNISVDEAKLQFGNNIEINTPEDEEFFTQINVWNDNVSLSFGFGPPQHVLDKILRYTDVIAKETGYFLYDPQDESVTDPLHPIALSEEEGKSWVDANEVSFLEKRKPWWKFW